jgi:hypothetical protein
MSIGSVSSASVQPAPKATPVEAAEATRGGKDMKNDGDSDDAAVARVSAPQPTTNFQGQAIGRTVNVTA